jgi:hypothetical protein
MSRLRALSLYPRMGATLMELLAMRPSPQAGKSLVIPRKRASTLAGMKEQM